MRPKVRTDAHQTGYLSELVCSNSFRSDDSVYNAVGLLHEELRLSNSLIMEAADKNKVPAGSALAVDRDMFSKYIDTKIKSNKYIKVINKEIRSLISWIGWQWEDMYLSPHLNSRSVLTRSNVQVRSPINSKSIDGWKNYKEMLKPSMEIITKNYKYRDLQY